MFATDRTPHLLATVLLLGSAGAAQEPVTPRPPASSPEPAEIRLVHPEDAAPTRRPASAPPAAGPGGAGLGAPTGHGGPLPPLPPLDPDLHCAPRIADQAIPGGALEASAWPSLGQLHPLSPDLFVAPGGEVGLGTLTPASLLHVEGGDVNLRDGALRVRGTDHSAPLELGTSTAEPRPHLTDGFTTVLGGPAPEATFATGDYSLRTADPVYGSVLETGVGSSPTSSRLHAGGPLGAGLELDVAGAGHEFDAHVGLGAGVWEVTADGAAGSTRFDGGSADGSGRLEVLDQNRAPVIEFDSTDDVFGKGGALTMHSDAGLPVLRAHADALGGGELSVEGDSGSGAILSAGNATGAQGSLQMWDGSGFTTLSLSALPPSSGSELRVYDTAHRQTVEARALSSLAFSTVAQLKLHNYSSGSGTSFVAAELRTPGAAPLPVLLLKSESGGGVTLTATASASSAGGGIAVYAPSLVFEIFNNQMTFYDSSGTPTIHYDGVSGDKNAVVKTSAGLRKLYCAEATEVWFEDAGVARLVDGLAEVQLDPIFLQTVIVDEAHPLHVAASPRGDSPGVWVEKHPERLVIHEQAGGPGDDWVDWRVQGHRVGHARTRLEAHGP